MKITEQSSPHRHLEQRSIEEITSLINQEDQSVALTVREQLPAINALIAAIVKKMEAGGRWFYLGAGSGGRLSVLDAIELPTTYGIEKGRVEPILAGGKERLIDALEQMEDDESAGWDMLQEKKAGPDDIVVGITASGTTPFVVAALKKCREAGITTGSISSNPQAEVSSFSDYPVEVITGPEFITGSTRMKCGTAQKMIFDMMSTTVMIRLGRVMDNRMVHVALINHKITDRAVRMIMDLGGVHDYMQAKELLEQHGSVKGALDRLPG